MTKYKISLERIIKGYEHLLFPALRLGLALIFIWFGALKILGYNPVYDLIHHSMAPFLAVGSGLVLLGLFEAVIGLLLFVNKWRHTTHLLLFLHLLGTFSTFVFGWHVVFDPYFPVLSLSGEFVIKNIVLATAGLVVLMHESERS